jgi:hypothetical protein
MQMLFENAVSIASLYLALVGLLSTFFYIQLGQWLSGILGNESKWQQVKDRVPKDTYFDKRLECYYDAVQSSSAWTFLGWLTVTVFLVIVGIFLETLRSSLKQDSAAYVFFYISLPTYVFLAIYLVLSVVMLVVGYLKTRKVMTDAKKSL